MSISKFNSEGYYDPTAYEALTTVEHSEKNKNTFRPMVFICSPYSGEIESNTLAARRYSRFAADRGYIPIAPHLLFTQFLDDSLPAERELGLFFGNVLMSKCAEVWVFGTYVPYGMEAEIDRAKRRNYTIRYFNTNCEEVTNVRDQK